MSSIKSSTQDFDLIKIDSFLKLTYPDGNLGTVIWDKTKTYYQEYDTNFFYIGEVNNQIYLDYRNFQTATINNIGEFADYLTDLLSNHVTDIISDSTNVNITRITNDPILDVARGVVSDKSVLTIIGSNQSVGVTSADIWCKGGNYNFLSTASTLEIMTQNIEDDITGLGARTILITGLDENYDEISEIVNLVGNDVSSSTTNSFLRVRDATVIDVGTERGSNYNEIMVQESGGGAMVCCIAGGYGTIDTSDFGAGRSQLGVYTVPAGKSAFMLSLTLVVSGGQKADTSINMYNNNIRSKPRMTLFELKDHIGIFDKDIKSYLKIPEKTDVWCRGKAHDEMCGIEFSMLLLVIDD